MSKPISDAQLYGLLWAAGQLLGTFSELHDVPHMVKSPVDGRRIQLFRTAFDRSGLLGLGRRGLLVMRREGLWTITEAGQLELKRPRTMQRIDAMADLTAEEQRKATQEAVDSSHE